VISVVVVPVVRSPGAPVVRVEIPVPVRAPDNVGRPVDEPYQRPGCDLIVGGGHHCVVCPVICIAPVSGIGCLGVDRLYNIIPAVEVRVTYQLYLYLPVTELLNGEDCQVLVLIAVECSAKDYGVNIAVNKIIDRDVVDIVIAVQVEVVDP
jgi:hypothetical protein